MKMTNQPKIKYHHIREANHSDIPEIIRMGELFSKEAGLEPDAETIAETMSGVIDSDDGLLLIGDGAMAIAVAYPLFMNSSIKVVQELAWWVDVEKRSGGIGRALLNGIQDWAINIGANRIMMIALESSPDHVDRFYRINGFKPMEKTYFKEL